MDNQLNLFRHQPRNKENVHEEDVKPREPVEVEKPLTAKERRKKKEDEYWRRVDQKSETEQQRIDRRAARGFKKIIHDIDKGSDDQETVEDDGPDKPYEDIYPYARNFRKK